MANIEIMSKRVEFIGTMKDNLTVTNDDGDEVPYFSPKFLIIKYLKMSEADLELNEKFKREEMLAKKKGDKDEEDDSDNEDDDMLGDNDSDSESEGDNESKDDNESDSSEEDDGGSDIDSEMLGDVQPESTETTQA